MSIHFDDVRREDEKTYFFLNCMNSGKLRHYLDADGIEYQCYSSKDFDKVLPAGMEIPPVLHNPIPELGLTAVVPYRFLHVIVSNLNTDDLMQKLIRILRGPDKPEDYRCYMPDSLRDKFNDPNFMKEITKNAVIPVAKSDAEMMESLLSSETDTDDGYDDEVLPFAEDEE